MYIEEIILYTNNLAGTEHFYSDIIGLSCIQKSQESLCYIAGTSRLSFQQAENQEAFIYHFAFNIPYSKMEEALDWCRNHVSIIVNDEKEYITDFPAWNARAIYFYDNNRNVIEFIGRKDLDQPSNLPFSPSLIDNISEIGIASVSPLAYSETLIRDFGMAYFTKGPKRADFAALGDDHGLLIISGTERHWYPTHDPVEQMPLMVKVSLRQQSFIIDLSKGHNP